MLIERLFQSWISLLKSREGLDRVFCELTMDPRWNQRPLALLVKDAASALILMHDFVNYGEGRGIPIRLPYDKLILLLYFGPRRLGQFLLSPL